MRGVRGATTAEENTAAAIVEAARELLSTLLKANQIQAQDVASIFFTSTADLTSAFPAQAARELGYSDTPILCSQELPVPGALPRCIRVLLHWNTARRADEIKHVYLRDAVRLRPDRRWPR
ncbi:MAG: chorismate mutase [Deltaproteobacteria bacterium]|nr:chorismate mutase [Deltaproteobacteria bacterium]